MRRRVVSSPSQGNAACGLEPQMQRGEHPTIARVVNGLDLQLELAGRLVNLSEELADALGPHVCALDRRYGQDQLNVGRAQRQIPIEVTVVDRATAARTISTFACDLAYSASPTALRASF